MRNPYPAVVVLVEDPAAAGVDLLMTLVGTTHTQRSVHVHVVTGQVQADQALKDDSPSGPGGAQEDNQARSRAAVGHHVQHGAEGGRLVKVTRCISIQCVEQTRHAVQKRTCARVEGHIVEGRESKDNSEIPCKRSLIFRSRSGVERAASAGDAQRETIPMRFGANRKMFSCSSSSLRADRDLFLEGVRLVDLDRVERPPFPVDKSSLSSAGTPKAAFCRRVRALIVDGGGVGC